MTSIQLKLKHYQMKTITSHTNKPEIFITKMDLKIFYKKARIKGWDDQIILEKKLRN